MNVLNLKDVKSERLKSIFIPLNFQNLHVLCSFAEILQSSASILKIKSNVGISELFNY